MKITERRATPEQVRYIEILANDLGVSREGRNAMLSDIANRTIKYVDELTLPEASEVITYFKELKDSQG